MPGSIRSRDTFEAGEIAEKLKEAMEPINTDEDAIIEVMGNYTNADRQLIATAYKTIAGEDLSEDLKSELSGDFEEMVLALMTPTWKYDAKNLHEAISGAGTDESTIIEILCTKSNCEIEQIKEAYKEVYDVDLEEDLRGETSGYFGRLLVSILAAGRETDEWFADRDRAMEDAAKLYNAGEAQWGTDEADINAILCLRSYCQLIETFNCFEEIAGKTIEESIESECSGDLKKGYLAIVGAVKDKPGFFAERLHDSLACWGTKDSDLIRIVVSRSEIDMEEIKQSYQDKFETSLAEAIDSDCGGDYKKMLLAIVNFDGE